TARVASALDKGFDPPQMTGTALEESLEDRRARIADAIIGECFDVLFDQTGEALAQVGIAGHKRHRGGEPFDIAGLDDEAIATMLDHARGAHWGGDDR